MPATLASPIAAAVASDLAPPVAVGRLVLLGHPVAHSLSPRFQNAALEAAGIPLTYAALDVAPAGLDQVLDALVAARAAGNVTLPHKERVHARCDLRSAVAERVGAVNTFWCTLDGLLCGDNTDVPGVRVAVTELLPAPPARIALLGAGGSAAAVLAAAEGWPGATVAVHARTRARAEALAERFPGVEVAASAASAVADADLVVNATPLGLRDDDALPIDPQALPPRAAVLDLVYRPGETAWVRAVRASGHAAADGLVMLIAQGAEAFVRWFGIEPDRDVLWRAVGGRPGVGP